MNDWTAGYVADIGYTYGCYSELNPGNLMLPLLGSGLRVPEVRTACELGFGQGLATNIHAAASDIRWYGTDFNPSQASFARELAGISQADCRLYDQSFDKFCNRSDLPDFDYIGLHGIWSWVSDDNRHTLVDFIQRKLSVGGVVYLGYNTLPGWSGFAPVRHLMAEHSERMGTEGGGIVPKINEALAFVCKLLETDPIFAKENPKAAERLEIIKNQNRNYLAHEYFNRDWHPMYFSTMAKWLEPAKLQFGCSANNLDLVTSINLAKKQLALLSSIQDQVIRESTYDYMINQQFRKDYWVKGVRKLTPLEQAEQIRELRCIQVKPREDISLKVKGAHVEGQLDKRIYAPLLDLTSDYKPRTFAEIEKKLKAHNVNFNQLVQAFLILTGLDYFAVVQKDEQRAASKDKCIRLNRYLINKSRSSDDISYLASPVTGGGVEVRRFDQMFILALSEGYKDRDELAKFVWKLFEPQGHRLMKDGKPLEKPEENLAELKTRADDFLRKKLSIYRALEVA